MPYITFVVPCYNSQDYMERCIQSLLAGGEDVEILIIDDGSTDLTGEIADRYQAQYPEMIRVVHQENGGHGAGVNKGLELARGLYFKVVDSDDWLDSDACHKLLVQIKYFSDKQLPDLIVCNYVYDHLKEGMQNTIHYRNLFPKERLCTWKEMGRFRPSQYLVMHALLFRTELLRKANVVLPKHTFYVDNLFACKPLPFVRAIYYMDVDLYHYYLGRQDQSVNVQVMIGRIDQLIRVTNLVTDAINLDKVKIQTPKLEKYLIRNISIMLAMTSIHLLLMDEKGSGEGHRKRRLLWEGIRERNLRLYRQLRYTSLSGFTYLPGKLGDFLTIKGYHLANKLIRFQ